MTEDFPPVTVLIAARPEQAEIKALSASGKLEYPGAKPEIIVARGKQPSAQRNAGLRAARGDIIYFLDDDSVPCPKNLLRASELLRDPSVVVVGGPNVCPHDAPELEQVFALVLSSWLAFGPSRARYSPVGKLRATGEKELILCNLAARRSTLLELGGFNEALYPNEENALMDELQHRGWKLMYDPDFVVQRRPRSHLRSFFKMLMTYGRGRAEQFRVNPTPGSALNFVPPIFVCYLLLLPVLISQAGGWALILLGMYGITLSVHGLTLVLKGGFIRGLGAAALVFVTHVLYGIGFWRGLFTSLKNTVTSPTIAVKLEQVNVP